MWKQVAVCALLEMGCGLSRPALVPGSDWGLEWRKFDSSHIELWTDLSAEPAKLVVSEFEKLYLIFEAATGVAARSPWHLQTRVVIFQNESDFRSIAGESANVLYLPSLPLDVQPTPTLIAYVQNARTTYAWDETFNYAFAQAHTELAPRHVFLHELAHRLEHVVMGPIPVWLAEGRAEFYSALLYKEDKLILGAANGFYGLPMRGFWLTPRVSSGFQFANLAFDHSNLASDVRRFKCDELQLPPGTELRSDAWEISIEKKYKAMWRLYHLLMFGPEPYSGTLKRAAQQASLKQGFAPTLERLLSGIPEAKLNSDFGDHLFQVVPQGDLPRSLVNPVPPSGKGTVLPFSVPEPESWERGKLSPAEALTLWVRLRPDHAHAREWMAKALQFEPLNEDVLFWNSIFHWKTGRAHETRIDLERVINPEKEEFLVGVAQYQQSLPPAQRKAGLLEQIEKQLLLKATHPAAWAELGSLHLGHQRKAEALTAFDKALKRDPGCWWCFATFGRAMKRDGNTAMAASALRTALENLSCHSPAAVRANLQREIQELERRDPVQHEDNRAP